MWDHAITALHIPTTTQSGRKRRLEQLNWATIVRDKCHKPDVMSDAFNVTEGLLSLAVESN
jgi:hypothetical protein